MGEALHPRRVEILRYLARRAGPMGHRRECMRWGSRRFEELADHPAPPLGRLEGKGFVVRECE